MQREIPSAVGFFTTSEVVYTTHDHEPIFIDPLTLALV